MVSTKASEGVIFWGPLAIVRLACSFMLCLLARYL
jgi:hypothetical protein